MNKFTQQTSVPVVPPPPASPNYADRQFLHTFLAGLLLPFSQATITAVMAFIATLTLFYLFNAVDLLKPALIVASIAWVLTWLYLMRRWLNITSFEQMTGIDINGDGVIGKKKPAEPLVLRVDDVRNGNYRSRTMNMDVSQDQLTQLARGILDGMPFTERKWAGAGKPFSSGQFRSLRYTWLKQELLEVVSDKENRQGFDFTDLGWAMLVKLAGVVPEDPPVSGPPVSEYADIPPNGRAQFGGSQDAELTDEQMEAIEKENAAYAEKYQS